MEIRKLNALRGLAAIIVFVTHFSDATAWLRGSLGGPAGQYGVMLFFLLSGFLMSYLYFEKTFTKDNIRLYIYARLGRVLPLYFLVVFSSYLFSLMDVQGLYDITDLRGLISHLLFVYGESVLWSISPEIHFYFIFLAFWSLAGSRLGYIYVLIAAVLLLLFFTNFSRVYGDIQGIKYNFFHVFRSFPYFFVGLIFGIHYRAFKVPDYLNKNWLILVLFLIPLMYPEFSPITTDAKYKMWLSFEVLFVMSTVFFTIVFLVPNNNIFLANKLGDLLGKISYSLYLLHMPVISIVNQYEISISLKLLLSVVMSIFVACLSYRYIEKPAARFIRNMAYDRSGRQAAIYCDANNVNHEQ